jgi:hypothetical protein
VFSAFNGFAIYKLSKFINCRYNTEIKLELFPAEKVKNKCKLISIFILMTIMNIGDLITNEFDIIIQKIEFIQNRYLKK